MNIKLGLRCKSRINIIELRVYRNRKLVVDVQATEASWDINETNETRKINVRSSYRDRS